MTLVARLRRWSRAGHYLLAAAVGAAAWCAAAAVMLSAPLSPAEEDAVGAALLADLVLGALALALLPLRRRYPLAVACTTVALTTVSVACMGPAALAVVSMASRRRRAWVGAVLAVSVAGGVVSEWLYRPRFTPGEDSVASVAGGVVLTVLFFAVAVATGYYIGARRELVASLQERVLTADREQALATRAAREAERTRIAREMHDVLAHRISLVALHAGALVYREDLSRVQTAEAAGTIQANAQLALVELRQVLGVLRSDHPADGVEQPQPTLAELPALLADAREADATVQLDTSGLGPRLPAIPETLSRTSFRIVQEALTNARKHAPGEAVTVRLAGAPGANLELDVRNSIGVRTGLALSSAGVGLAGLTERAELAGGALEYGPQPDGSFVVRATLPWPA
jgi:signal transduction histidine kinase